ncbi:hypothetical protein [Bremerella alba]|uniref:Uncharacterized protein n=1 Tax=Bremerella alba TaxID=980252 RepID=A0A7V8V4J1_9BACT|nr:hypothetical protein [Bremerella alba]MBA2114690.1 hypothetical protein [Bremerella alba]
MRNVVLAFLLLLASAQVATAQRVNINGPGNVRLPEGLVTYMQYLQEEQLESLQLFTTYLEERVKEKAVPEGVLLNVQAIYTEAQLRASGDKVVKQEKLGQLVEIYDKRKQLDAQNPNATWFGVNRLKLGTMMQTEYEAFRREAEQPKKASPRKER